MTSAKAFRLGLIGHPVSHSKSPEIFREKFNREGFSNASYELFDLPNLENFDQTTASNKYWPTRADERHRGNRRQ